MFKPRTIVLPSLVCTIDLKSDRLPASSLVSFGTLLGHLAFLVSCCLTPSFDVLHTVQAPEDTLYPDPSCLIRRNRALKTHVSVSLALLNDFVRNKLENNAPKVLFPGGC